MNIWTELRLLLAKILGIQSEVTAAFFAVLALANEVVWRTMSTDAWVNYKGFGVTLAVFLFFGINIFRLSATHSVEPRSGEQRIPRSDPGGG